MSRDSYTVEYQAIVTLEVDPKIIDIAMEPEWQASFYKFRTRGDVIDHLAYNLGLNKWRLTQLDGWADQSDDDARVIRVEYELLS